MLLLTKVSQYQFGNIERIILIVITIIDTYIAKVGAGVRLGNMAEALFAQGQRALPHGVCPAVGVGGHATHGGFGYAARM